MAIVQYDFHHRTIVLSQCSHGIVVNTLSRYCIIAMASLHCCHGNITPSPSHYNTITLLPSELYRITMMALTVFHTIKLYKAIWQPGKSQNCELHCTYILDGYCVCIKTSTNLSNLSHLYHKIYCCTTFYSGSVQ